LLDRLNEAVKALAPLLKEDGCPKIGLILGSGLGVFADELQNARSIPYSAIPGFPQSTVVGHKGRLVFGYVGDISVIALQGRFHTYEGYKASEVAFPARVLVSAGVDTLIVTNAAGGLGDGFEAGDLMLITDHLNFSGQNPLIGPHDPIFGERFPDMSEAYSRRLCEDARSVAKEQGLELKEGVYAVLGGPSYETPAEVRAMKTLGADAVGMSTVYEVIVARQMGAKILGLSLISNLAAGISETPLSHEEVVEAGREAADRFVKFIRGVVCRFSPN
jgi:purine-nucleoside phosphorylase